MKKIITQVDRNGNVRVMFSGFVGDECVQTEDRLRRMLAGLGLAVAERTAKRTAESEANDQQIRLRC